MSLPATDAFTGAVGELLSAHNAGWTKMADHFTAYAQGGVFLANDNGGYDMYQWTGDSFNTNSYSQATNATANGDGLAQTALLVRCSSTDFYMMLQVHATGVCLFFKYTHGGGFALLSTPGDLNWDNGIVGKLVATGSNPTALEFFVGGVSAATDSSDSDLDSGAAGIGGLNNGQLDDWEGGNTSSNTNWIADPMTGALALAGSCAKRPNKVLAGATALAGAVAKRCSRAFTGALSLAGAWITYLQCDAADFDGTNDYLTRGAALTGVADSKYFTLSFWVRRSVAPAGQQILLIDNGGDTIVIWDTDGTIDVISGAGDVFFVSTDPIPSDGLWHHFVCACDNQAAQAAMYIDGASQPVSAGSVTMSFTAVDWVIAADSPAYDLKYQGCMAEFAFWPGTYVDLSSAAIRGKFRSRGRPANMGTDASRPTGVAAAIYLHLDPSEAPANFALNRGTGGNFTVNGALTTCSSGPSSNVFTQALTGALAFAGGVVKKTYRAFTGALALTGPPSNTTTTNANMAGVLNLTGAQTKAVGHGLTGALAFAGAVSKRTSRALTGATALAGAVSKATSRALTGATALAGTISKSASRALTGSTALAGSVSKSTGRPLTGATVLAGTCAKAVGKACSGALALAGAVSKSTARALTGALALAGAWAYSLIHSGPQVYQQALEGALNLAGSVSKRTSRALTGALALAGTLVTGGAIILAGIKNLYARLVVLELHARQSTTTLWTRLTTKELKVRRTTKEVPDDQ